MQLKWSECKGSLKVYLPEIILTVKSLSQQSHLGTNGSHISSAQVRKPKSALPGVPSSWVAFPYLTYLPKSVASFLVPLSSDLSLGPLRISTLIASDLVPYCLLDLLLAQPCAERPAILSPYNIIWTKSDESSSAFRPSQITTPTFLVQYFLIQTSSQAVAQNQLLRPQAKSGCKQRD